MTARRPWYRPRFCAGDEPGRLVLGVEPSALRGIDAPDSMWFEVRAGWLKYDPDERPAFDWWQGSPVSRLRFRFWYSPQNSAGTVWRWSMGRPEVVPSGHGFEWEELEEARRALALIRRRLAKTYDRFGMEEGLGMLARWADAVQAGTHLVLPRALVHITDPEHLPGIIRSASCRPWTEGSLVLRPRDAVLHLERSANAWNGSEAPAVDA